MVAREALLMAAREVFVLAMLVGVFAWVAWQLVRNSRH